MKAKAKRQPRTWTRYALLYSPRVISVLEDGYTRKSALIRANYSTPPAEILRVQVVERSTMKAVCSWRHESNEREDYWEASCGGGLFCLTDGDLASNKFKFCPYCGLPVVEQLPKRGKK